MQLPTDLPQFVFFANLPKYIKDPYRRFVENKLHKKFNFEGVPLDIFFREKQGVLSFEFMKKVNKKNKMSKKTYFAMIDEAIQQEGKKVTIEELRQRYLK